MAQLVHTDARTTGARTTGARTAGARTTGARTTDAQAMASEGRGTEGRGTGGLGTEPSARGVRLALAAVAAFVALLAAGALVLWARNGSAVFFDTVSAGLASCL